MMMNEFVERTGFEPTMEEYREIEEAYYNFDGDKNAFCKHWMETVGEKGMLMERAIYIENLRAAIKKKNKDMEIFLAQKDKEIANLTAALEREQEWKAIEDEHNVKQAEYEKLESDKFTKVLTDEEAASLIADEFGFVESKVKIIHEIDKEEVNRHGQCRRNGKFVRKALFNAWDWNYIRFNVCGMAYEMHDGELKLFWH